MDGLYRKVRAMQPFDVQPQDSIPVGLIGNVDPQLIQPSYQWISFFAMAERCQQQSNQKDGMPCQWPFHVQNGKDALNPSEL